MARNIATITPSVVAVPRVSRARARLAHLAGWILSPAAVNGHAARRRILSVFRGATRAQAPSPGSGGAGRMCEARSRSMQRIVRLLEQVADVVAVAAARRQHPLVQPAPIGRVHLARIGGAAGGHPETPEARP